jgi:hypothetical protein
MKYEDLILISNPYTVYIKFKKKYSRDSEIKISTSKNKKYMIYDIEKNKWFHFGSTMEDYTKHKDARRRINFFIRNKRWSDAGIYTPLMLPIIYYGDTRYIILIKRLYH